MTSTIPAVLDGIITATVSSGIVSGLIAVGSESAETQLNQISNNLRSAIENLQNSLLGTEIKVTVDQWEQIRKKLPKRFGIYISKKSVDKARKQVDPTKHLNI